MTKSYVRFHWSNERSGTRKNAEAGETPALPVRAALRIRFTWLLPRLNQLQPRAQASKITRIAGDQAFEP